MVPPFSFSPPLSPLRGHWLLIRTGLSAFFFSLPVRMFSPFYRRRIEMSGFLFYDFKTFPSTPMLFAFRWVEFSCQRTGCFPLIPFSSFRSPLPFRPRCLRHNGYKLSWESILLDFFSTIIAPTPIPFKRVPVIRFSLTGRVVSLFSARKSAISFSVFQPTRVPAGRLGSLVQSLFLSLILPPSHPPRRPPPWAAEGFM